MKKTKTPTPADDAAVFEDWMSEDKGDVPPLKKGTSPLADNFKEHEEVEADPPPVTEEVLKMTSDVSVNLVAVIGRKTVSVKDVMGYQAGQVVDLGRPPGETVDLVASGKLFARGELVEIDGKLGVRIVKLMR